MVPREGPRAGRQHDAVPTLDGRAERARAESERDPEAAIGALAEAREESRGHDLDLPPQEVAAVDEPLSAHRRLQPPPLRQRSR